MTRSTIRVLCLALLASGCCFGGSDPEPAEPIPDWLRDPAGEHVAITPDDLFVYADTMRAEGVSAPPRLHAALPSTVAGMHDWPPDALPRNQVVARLRADDSAMVALWLDGATAAARTSSPAEAGAAYASLLRYASGPILDDLRRRAAATPTPGAHEAVMIALAYDGDPRDEARLTADDAPASATVAFFGAHPIGALTDAQANRLVTALEAHLRSATVQDDILDPCGEGVSSAIGRLARTGHVDALLGALEHVTGPMSDCLAMELGDVDDPRAQERFAAACPRMREATFCAGHEPPPPIAAMPEPAAQSAEDAVHDFEFDVSTVPSNGPRRTAIRDALAACADSDAYQARGCLANLAALDYPLAVEHARTRLAAHADATDPEDTARALVAFPQAGGMMSYAHAQGLIGADEVLPEGAHPVTPLDALEWLGHATQFDTETDQFPNEHDTLLVELSALSPSTLHGVVFEEIVQGTPGGVDLGGGIVTDGVVDDQGQLIEGDEPQGTYVLHAFDDHTRYEVYAENLGDWYDVDAVVGLLNVVASQRGSNVRWLVLATGDQTAIVVAGPADGLRRAVTDGWLDPGGLGASAASRDAERAILEQLLQEEAPPP